MFQTTTLRAVLLSLGVALFAWNSGAQAPLTINGPTDRQVTTGNVTVNVPSTAGYTYQVLLDGVRVPTDLNHVVSRMDYHEVFVSRTNVATGVVTNRTVRFIVRSTNRGSPETGLIEWLPYPMVDSAPAELVGAQLKIITPEDFPQGLEIPVAAWIEDAQGKAIRANATVTAPGQPSIRVRRGVGSGYLPAATSAGSIDYPATIPGATDGKTINIEASTTWTSVSGTLNGAVVWPDDSRISVTGTITIPAGSSLTIGAGTVVRLNAGVDVNVRGRLTVNGGTLRPVVFTPVTRSQPWGGLITTNAFPAQIDATGAFFVGSGAKQNWFSNTGYDTHLAQQACFVLDGASGNFTNCFFLDGRGQVGHGRNGNLNMVHSIAQRFLTGGEYVGGTIVVDKSAFIEFPQDDGIVNPTIADADNDGIYFTTGTHIMTDSLFGWCKDDAIDSGSGGAGTVVVSNCWVESALHEALAWSGTGRQTWTYDTVLINNGQGLECGWSGGANSPIVWGGRVLSTANSVGTRYGDNYEGTSGLGLKDGFLTATNSFFLYNYRDVWGRVWDNTWDYRVVDMDIRLNFLTQPNSFHPVNNTVWNPLVDSPRLAPFMSTPPDAPVGVGLAVWTNQFAMSDIFAGVPVRLSSFTTNSVAVHYAWLSQNMVFLSLGSVTFAPGETVKTVYPSGFDVASRPFVRFALINFENSQLTGVSSVDFQGAVPTPVAGLSVPTPVLPGYRIVEGTFVRLSSPSALPVSIPYTNITDGQVHSTGTLVFAPLETSRQLFFTGGNPFDFASVVVSLGQPTNATLAGITSVTYTNPVLAVAFGVAGSQANAALLSTGLPVALNGPAGSGVAVNFSIDDAGTVLTNGTLTFAPGEGTKPLLAPTVNIEQHPLTRATLSNPTGAQLGSPSSVYLVKTLTAPPATNTTLISRGARWRYRDAASAAPAGWNTLGFDHQSWLEGPAQLGFSNGEEGDEATLIADNNQITSYFRRGFNVADSNAFNGLSLWLLRDDGGVVYLNGTEIFRTPNLPAAPAAILYTTLTTSGQNGENTIDNWTTNRNALRTGTNVVAVEIHQATADSSDVSFDFELIGIGAPPPPPPQSIYMVSFAPDKLTIAWGDSSFRLEQTDDLQTTGTIWIPVNQPSPVTIDLNEDRLFYRLVR